MRRRFLLDENLIYHAIKGVDEYENLDYTSAELFMLIARNCHSITLNHFLRARYLVHLRNLETNKSGALQPAFLLNLFFKSQNKVVWELDERPRLPQGCGIPDEDVEIVRSALISHPIVVSADGELRDAINACEALHLTAVAPAEALTFAREPCRN